MTTTYPSLKAFVRANIPELVDDAQGRQRLRDGLATQLYSDHRPRTPFVIPAADADEVLEIWSRLRQSA